MVKLLFVISEHRGNELCIIPYIILEACLYSCKREPLFLVERDAVLVVPIKYFVG